MLVNALKDMHNREKRTQLSKTTFACMCVTSVKMCSSPKSQTYSMLAWILVARAQIGTKGTYLVQSLGRSPRLHPDG